MIRTRATNERLLVLTVVVLGVTVGCSTHVPLQHTNPAARLSSSGPVIGCRATEDRRANRAIDEALDSASLAAVDRALQAEVAGAGIAQQVVALPGIQQRADGDARQNGVAVVVEPVLEEMVWEVPGYDQMMTTTFVVSVLTGGVGGLAYGVTPIDVLGRTKLTVTFVDVATGRQLTKTYATQSQESMMKMSSDASDTQSKLVGQSLTAALQQFRTDLVSFVGTPSTPAVGSAASPAGS